MRTVNIHEAKTTLSKLLDEVERGGRVTIARNGKPVAELRAITRPSLAEAVEDLRAGLDLRIEGIAIRDLIDEGRR